MSMEFYAGLLIPMEVYGELWRSMKCYVGLG